MHISRTNKRHKNSVTNLVAAITSVLLLTSFSIPTAARIDDNPRATESDEPKWYQIEVFIFSQTGEGAEDSEVWRKDIQLSYPKNLVELKEPEQDDIEEKETLFTAEDIPADFIFNEREPYPKFAPIDEIASEAESNSIVETPFTLLPKEQLILADTRKKLTRFSMFKPLFHAAWRQPVLDSKNSPSIIIKGGESINDHFELEGTISISVARYLHFTSNLWHTSFKPNFGQPQEDWPLLPAYPIFDEELPNPEFAHDDSEFMPLQLWEDFQIINQHRTPLLQGEFLIDRVVALNQQRRMRSKELHYLDHPLFGILVQIEPYEVPKLEEEFEFLESEEIY